MKKIYFILLTVVLILTGCGGKRASQMSELTPEFFSGGITGEITVSAYDSMAYKSYLEEAARAFEEQYPGAKVKIETFSAMPEIRTGEQGGNQMILVQMQDDPQGRTDYISRINTNIMSGEGADIYAMDILPIHKFTESGTLENLKPYMSLDPNFNKAEYRQNILDALNYRNGVWFIPMDYTFNYFAYDASLVPPQIASGFGADKTWNTDELFKLGIPMYNGTYKLFSAYNFSRGPSNSIFKQLLNENIQSFLNLETSRADFSGGGFSSLLSSVKHYTEQGYIPGAVTGQQDAGQMMRITSEAVTDRFFFKLNSNTSLISQFLRGTGRIMRVEGGGARNIDDNDEIAGIQSRADGSVPFEYTRGFAVNNQSKNKLTAWAFIKFLLTKEMQLSSTLVNMGLPVNNEARAEKAELAFSGALYGRPGEMNDQMRQAMERYKAAVEKLSDNIDCFTVQDTVINDMISNEVRYFFTDNRAAGDVAGVIQNKADLYLSE
ncbi:MAG: ABC transporter substrate-binding protein [Treponema sp.]|nr:ABC transporter substrate-binding protein [Treponema sp.]